MSTRYVTYPCKYTSDAVDRADFYVNHRVYLQCNAMENDDMSAYVELSED